MIRTVVSDRKYGPEFESYVQDILLNPYFKILKYYTHHGIERYDHCVTVAYDSFVIAKKLNLDVRSVARGALLHDFFFDLPKEQKKEMRKSTKGLKKITTFQGFTHPKTAANNARHYFEINALEEDIIEKHMFPLTIKPPRHLESWIVNGVDTSIALKELFKTFGKHPYLTITGKIKTQG